MRLLQELRVVIAVVVLLALGHLVMHLAAAPGDRLHAFIYQRGVVQYLILVVAAFALVLLYSRRRQYHRSAARFRAFERGRGNPTKLLAETLQKVGRFCTDYGTAAANSRVERFHDEQSKAVQKDYDVVYFFVGSLPVLGLLGTMLGLSDALYAAFSQGFGAESVEDFVAGLSTALDTTVLAMVCAAPLFACTSLQIRQESNLVNRYAECLRERFGLADAPEKDKATYVIYAELCRLTKQIGQEAKAMFAEVLGTSVAALRETLGEAVQKQLAEHRQNELHARRAADRQIADQWEKAVRSLSQALEQQQQELATRLSRAVAENVAQPVQAVAQAVQNHSQRTDGQLPELVSRALTDALAQATRVLDQRHASLAERMTHQMGRLEAALRNRTPEEVVIRYRENGAAHRGA